MPPNRILHVARENVLCCDALVGVNQRKGGRMVYFIIVLLCFIYYIIYIIVAYKLLRLRIVYKKKAQDAQRGILLRWFTR